MSAHYQLTRLAIALGPRNPLVGLMLRRQVARYGATVRVRSTSVDLAVGSRVIRMALATWPYAASIAASFDSYFGQVEPAAEGHSMVVDYSRPRLQRYRSSGLEFEISSFPEEDSAIAGYFRWYRPGDGDTVFDLGAYCGMSCYAFSKAVGDTGRVIAFEPDALSHELLLRNIERHRLRNVTTVHAAVAASSGTAAFNQEGTLGSVLSRHSGRPTTRGVSDVETISFADACERFGTPAFVKMDIEGSEIEVLEGARAFLSAHPIQFAIDTHHWIGGVRTTEAVEATFRAIGYEVDSSDASGFWTTWARP